MMLEYKFTMKHNNKALGDFETESPRALFRLRSFDWKYISELVISS